MTKEEILNGSRAILLDLDGTVYLDEKPIGRMRETLARLRDMRKQIGYVTNASLKTEEEYRNRLSEIGLWDNRDDVFTSATTAVEYLLGHCAGKKVYLLATDALKRRFAERGIDVTEGEDAEVCVLAYDTSFTFAKMRRFNDYLQKGAFYLATHTDLVCPTSTLPQPDVGSMIAFFRAASGREPDVISGKPGKIMAECVSRRMGVPFEKMCMIGDRLYTDIRFGQQNGMSTVLVLTGEANRNNLKDYPDRPDLILPDLNALVF